MEERVSLPIDDMSKKAFYNFDFRTATKLDDLMRQRQKIAKDAYINIEEDNAHSYFTIIGALENEIKKLLNID